MAKENRRRKILVNINGKYRKKTISFFKDFFRKAGGS